MSFTKKTCEKKKKNKTRRIVKGGMLPIILIENAPLIISGIGAAFNIIINWVITANKTIDNYKAVQKLRSTVKPAVVVATKPAAVVAAKPAVVAAKPATKPVFATKK